MQSRSCKPPAKQPKLAGTNFYKDPCIHTLQNFVSLASLKSILHLNMPYYHSTCIVSHVGCTVFPNRLLPYMLLIRIHLHVSVATAAGRTALLGQCWQLCTSRILPPLCPAQSQPACTLSWALPLLPTSAGKAPWMRLTPFQQRLKELHIQTA